MLHAADQTRAQETGANHRQHRAHGPHHVQRLLNGVHIFRQTVRRGRFHVLGLRRRHNGCLGGNRRGHRILNGNDIALEGHVLLQKIFAGGGKLILSGHGNRHVPAEIAALPRGNGGEMIQLHSGGGYIHILDLVGALIGNRNGKLHRAGERIDRIPVAGGGDTQHHLVVRAHRGDGYFAGTGNRFQFIGIRRRQGKKIIRRVGNGYFLGVRFRLARIQGQVGKHLPQGGVSHIDVGIIDLARIFQRKGQGHHVAGHAALLVRFQAGGQVHLAVFDGGLVLLGSQGLAIGLVGNGRLAGQVLGTHGHRKGIAALFPRGNAGNGAGALGNAAVFLDGHIRDLYLAGIDHIINDVDLLPLLRNRRGNGPVDLHLDLGVLRRGGGIGDGNGIVLGLVGQLTIVIIHGVLDLEGDFACFQLFLRHVPVTTPGLASARGQGRAAKLLHRLPVRIIQGYRARKILLAGIGNGDGYGDRLRSRKLVLAQLHGEL